MRRSVFLSLALVPLCGAFLAASSAYAQTLQDDVQAVWQAEVVSVSGDRIEAIPGTGLDAPVQEVEARILEGARAGEVVSFTNDYIQLKEGDSFYMNYTAFLGGRSMYSVRDIDRRGALGILLAAFIAVILAFGGRQGVRSLMSLFGSLLAIAYVLVPGLAKGYPPVPTSIFVATLVLFFAIFFTHGFNRRSAIAFAGTIISVALTGIIAHAAIGMTGLTGFSSEESFYLNLNTGGTLDFVGLLLAAVIIGALGVLDDVAVTQVAVVRELIVADGSLSKREIYRRAMRVGKEHVGALVNTLVLAYTGAALPLLLLFSFAEGGFLSIVNREIFAVEIVRSLVGSIGLVLTVPITTLLAASVLRGRPGTDLGGSGVHAHHH